MNAQHIEELGQRFLQRLRRGFLDPVVNRRLARAATLVLIVVVAWIAAGLTWQWLSPPPPLPRLQSPADTASSAAKRQPAPVENIVSQHLFGQASVTPVKTQGPIVAPETRLRLVLHGVFASPDPALAMAIIAEKGGHDRAYRRGEALPGGATLHEIYPDRVILSRNGRLETLKLIRRHDSVSVGSARTARSARATPPPGRRTVRRVPQLQEVKRLYHNDPQKLLKQIRITPVMKDGELIGYRFNHNDRALMRAAGLLPQDIITEINGISVQDAPAMFNLLQNVDQLQELQLVIMRRGIPQQLTLKLN